MPFIARILHRVLIPPTLGEVDIINIIPVKRTISGGVYERRAGMARNRVKSVLSGENRCESVGLPVSAAALNYLKLDAELFLNGHVALVDSVIELVAILLCGVHLLERWSLPRKDTENISVEVQIGREVEGLFRSGSPSAADAPSLCAADEVVSSGRQRSRNHTPQREASIAARRTSEIDFFIFYRTFRRILFTY